MAKRLLFLFIILISLAFSFKVYADEENEFEEVEYSLKNIIEGHEAKLVLISESECKLYLDSEFEIYNYEKIVILENIYYKVFNEKEYITLKLSYNEAENCDYLEYYEKGNIDTENNEKEITRENNGEIKGFIEEYWGVLLASFGGNNVGLAILYYFMNKAIKNAKKVIDKYAEEKEISEQNKKDLNALIETITNYNDKLMKAYFDKLEDALKEFGKTQAEIDDIKSKFDDAMLKLQENDNAVVDILKTALLSDVGIVNDAVVDILDRKFKDYEENK